MLEGWDNFYVILGSAAAGLLGLTFVVIALLSDMQGTHSAGMRGYITPTVVHFGIVLASCAFMSVPRQNVTSLSVWFGGLGVGTLIYTGVIVRNMRRFESRYVAVMEDWIWHAILPALAYAAVLMLAFLLWSKAQQALYGLAATLMVLLFIGIHNAWDVAVSVTMQKQKEDAGKSESSGG